MEKLIPIHQCKTLGESLQVLRKTKKLTQEVLAERIKVHQSYIAQIETQGKIPSPEAIIKILKTLNVNSTDLMHIKMQYYQADLGDVEDKFKQLVAHHHGSNSNTVDIRATRGEGKSFSVALVDFVLMNQKANSRVTAVSFLKEFAPRKADDEDLIGNLADAISNLRKVQAKLL